MKELLIYKKRGMTSIQVEAHQPLNTGSGEKRLYYINKQLHLLEETPIVVVERVKDEVLSRRALFESFQKEGKQLAKKNGTSGMEDGER